MHLRPWCGAHRAVASAGLGSRPDAQREEAAVPARPRGRTAFAAAWTWQKSEPLRHADPGAG
eukprot:6116896-Alexandrium_andersonii.AAC.1